MSEGSALAGRMRTATEEADRVLDRAVALGRKARASGDNDYWDGVALNLHGYYTSIERVFEDIARTIDGGLPAGPDWHQRLLLQMSSALAERRPAIISRETRSSLEQYRGFRHVVRSVYAFTLDPVRIGELLDRLPATHEAVRAELLAFAAMLDAAA